jgi:hypothetical protein
VLISARNDDLFEVIGAEVGQTIEAFDGRSSVGGFEMRGWYST